VHDQGVGLDDVLTVAPTATCHRIAPHDRFAVADAPLGDFVLKPMIALALYFLGHA
jgi:hypothetical protein